MAAVLRKQKFSDQQIVQKTYEMDAIFASLLFSFITELQNYHTVSQWW